SNSVSPPAFVNPGELPSASSTRVPNSSELSTHLSSTRNCGHANKTESGTRTLKRGNLGYQKRPSTTRPLTRVAIPELLATASSRARRGLHEPRLRARTQDTGRASLTE